MLTRLPFRVAPATDPAGSKGQLVPRSRIALHTAVEPGSLTARLLDGMRCLVPGSCVLCGFPVRAVISLCDDCRACLPRVGNGCSRCGVELATDCSAVTCGRCIVDPPPFDLCRGVFRYDFPVRQLITDFKFRGNFAAGRALAWLLADAIVNHYRGTERPGQARQLPDALVPVPLYPNRLKQRGFNQALLLARVISRRTGIPVAPTLLSRERDTPSQSQLNARRRRANLRCAFRPGVDLTRHNLNHVAIIDDVVTTTATVDAASRALRADADCWTVNEGRQRNRRHSGGQAPLTPGHQRFRGESFDQQGAGRRIDVWAVARA